MTQLITRCAGAFVVVFAVLAGRPIQTASQAAREIRIEVPDSPRPLAAAVRQVEEHFGRVVTYEDGSCVNPGDIDETDLVVKDENTGRRVFGRRLDSITLAHRPAGESADAHVQEVLALLLEKWNGPSHSGEFRAQKVVGGFHVIPVARKGVGGTTEPYSSPLEARVTIAKEERVFGETLSVLARAVSDGSGREVDIAARYPWRLDAVKVVLGAENQMAREVLWNALQATDRTLSWRLLCATGEDSTCTLNVYRVTPLE